MKNICTNGLTFNPIVFNRGSYKYFEVKIKFLPRRDFESLTNLTYKEIMKYVVKQFLVNVDTNIKKENIIIERTT